MDINIFIGAIVAGVTEALRIEVPRISGGLTVLCAAIVGGLVGAVDVSIGLTNITIAQGIFIGLGTAGVTATAKKIG